MSHSSRDTSPDPIVLPSSPLGRRSSNIQSQPHKSPKPCASRSSQLAQFSSPSKSLILDTGKSGDASPWRIKVTVEAEPKDGSSPAKRITRTTKVPLKGGNGSSSPAKKMVSARNSVVEENDDSEGPRPQRKRKGTPIRRRSARMQSTMKEQDISIDDEGFTHIDSPAKQRPAQKRRSPMPTSTERTKRLSHARQELDFALQEAVGRSTLSSPEFDDDGHTPAGQRAYDAGDMTIANEDFTMISVETLESMKQNTSQILERSGFDIGDQSAASMSYMPSSPPVQMNHHRSEILYPEISVQALAAKDRRAFTSPVVNPVASRNFRSRFQSAVSRIPNSTLHNDTAKQRNDDMRDTPMDPTHTIGVTAERAIVIEDDTQGETEDSESAMEVEGGQAEDDIWAEEASRSLEEEQQEDDGKGPTARESPKIAAIFGNEPLKPPRAKIPRTWRQISGTHFNYSDSPDYDAVRKASAASKDVEGDGADSRSSGVLTPPSTDDEAGAHNAAAEAGESSITVPRNAATAFQPHVSVTSTTPERSAALSPQSDSSGDTTSPDRDDDTGIFWQANLPNVFHRPTRPRFQRKPQAMDLSELLNLNKTPSPAKERQTARPAREGGFAAKSEAQPQVNGANADQRRASHASMSLRDDKLLSSPLRKSLLKSSKIRGITTPIVSASQSSAAVKPASAQPFQQTTSPDTSHSQSVHDGTMESFQSQASDQRQLLDEMYTASSSQKPYDSGSEDESQVEDEYDSAEESFQEDSSDWSNNHDELQSGTRIESLGDHSSSFEDPTRSYEEHLNLDSPQKIRVNFNDASGNSSLLTPKKQYPPLFGSWHTALSTAGGQTTIARAPKSTAEPEPKPSTSQPGLFSRLSTTLWSAVVRPAGPSSILPEDQTPEPIYDPILRRDIRSRYGVLSDQHPWTMAHMRTLHRLLNSCTSGKSDSIVPTSGPLPSGLAKLVHHRLVSVSPEFSWTFTTQHAHVVDAFMQTLVPEHIAEAIKSGEMDFLGDRDAKKHRGLWMGRHGDMIVFAAARGLTQPVGGIQWAWVVKALGNCVMANIETARREREAAANAG